MSSNFISKRLATTLAFKDLSDPVILTSGELGIYYINTEKLLGDEGMWKTYGENDHAMIQHASAMMVRDADFRHAINLMAESVQVLLGSPTSPAISGGQRRDWLFSGPIAAVLGIPHVSIYKDGKMNVVYSNAKREIIESLDGYNVVHVVDLLTEGSSVLSAEGNSGWVPWVRKAGGEVSSLYTVVNRNQGGKERLEKVGVETFSAVSIDEAFVQRINAAKSDGKVLRYIGNIIDGKCQVSIEAVGQDHPLYGIKDGENALAIHSRYYQPLPFVLRGYGAGAAVTAAGVFGDLLRTLAWEQQH